MELIDLTHTFSEPMPLYPGDDQPEIRQTSFLEKDGYNDFSLKSGMHVGTHIDAPLHFIAGGKKMSEIPVNQFFGRGRLVDARGELTIHAGLLDKIDLKAHDIVLVMTGRSKDYQASSYFQNFPEVTEDFAQILIDKGVSMLGLDTCSPDKEPYAIHKMLLGAGVLIIEDLANLEALVGTTFSVIALPLKIEAEASLARVVAGVDF
jgi:kynurenine formamidase